MSVISWVKGSLKNMEEGAKRYILNDTPPSIDLSSTPTMKALGELAKRYRLAKLLPYETYDEVTGLYHNADSVGFVLCGAPATGLSSADLKILNGIFNQSHKSNTAIQVSIVSDTNIEPLLELWRSVRSKTGGENIFKVLSHNRVAYLRNGKWRSLFSDQPYLIRNLHFLISYTIPIGEGVKSIDAAVDEIDFLKRMRVGIKSTLRSVNVSVENLDPKGFINLLNGILNPQSGAQPDLEYDNNQLIAEQMVDADSQYLLGSGASAIRHKEEIYSVLPFHVRQYPQYWPGYKNGELIGSFFKKALRIPCPFIVNLNISVPDQVSAKSLVKAKKTRTTQMADSDVAKFVSQWKERKRDWEYTSARIDNGDRLLKALYQVVLIMPKGVEEECSQALNSIYESLGWTLSRSRYTPIHTFLGALPMGLTQEMQRQLHLFGQYHSMLSWNCTNVAPWIGEWKGTKTPLLMFAGRRGQLLFFNPFDNDKGNFNIACSASPGSGKSFMTNEIIASVLAFGGRIFVIDSGHSYRNICKLLKGTYIDFSEQRLVINPFNKIFDRKRLLRVKELSKRNPAIYNEKDYLDDFMPLIKELLIQMASPGKPLDEMRASCLEEAIMDAVSENHENTTITHVVEKLKAQDDPRGYAYDVAKALYSYTKDGMYGKYFEGKNNVDLDNRFVVLELDALKDKGILMSVVLSILMTQINQAMYLAGNKAQLKMVIIDEAWKIMEKGRTGQFIEEGYRVARKHGGSYS